MPLQEAFELGVMIFKSFVRLLYSPLFWFLILLLYYQSKRIQKTKEEMFGLQGKRHRPMITVAAGLGGGLLGSFLLIAVGLNLNDIGIIWLWPAAVLLLLIHPRFLCFSYAGGLVSLVSIFFGLPKVDIPQLMALVAILHLVEGMLILFSGHLGATPVYTRNKAGRVIGAFNLQTFWPIPLVALAAVIVSPSGTMSELVNMPSWWPLIRPVHFAGTAQTVYQLLPVVAAVGYGDLAAASQPREKSRRMAINLFIYSICLLGISVFASHRPQLTLLAALFGPFGHELVIRLGTKGEMTGKPLYIQPDRGVMVLDVWPDSPAWLLGLRTGDIILDVNGVSVNCKEDFLDALENSFGLVDADWLPFGGGKPVTGQIRKNLGQPLGIILAPAPNDAPVMELISAGILGSWLSNFGKRLFHQVKR